MKNIVYIHTAPSGKRYIGQTTMKPEHRWGKSGGGYKGFGKFWRAIQKYGWDNFSHQVIEVDSPEEANYLERYLIKFYDTIKNGYNCSPGGKNNVEGISEETRQRMSDSHKGQRHTEEWKSRMSAKRRGVKKSPEHVEAMSKARLGKPRPTKRWLTPDGSIVEMMTSAAHRFHPDWVQID
jgi:group I intron endonuclease